MKLENLTFGDAMTLVEIFTTRGYVVTVEETPSVFPIKASEGYTVTITERNLPPV